jgi:hypothetical protein
MWKRPKSVWLALAAGALLLTLSVSSAFGADPPDEETNRGQQVADFVHDLIFGDEDSNDEDTPEDEDTTEDEEVTDEDTPEDEEVTDEESADGPPDNHGQCVRLVAVDTDTGGPNDNHGGAVSEAARVTCWEDGEDSEGSEASAEDESEKVRGNSANAHEMGHGHGHGGNH